MLTSHDPTHLGERPLLCPFPLTEDVDAGAIRLQPLTPPQPRWAAASAWLSPHTLAGALITVSSDRGD